MATIEASLPWGGDFALDSTGDLLLVEDSSGSFPALTQRITQMLLTTPLITDAYGNALSTPDDMFHPTTGAGLRWAVGRNASTALLQQIETAILTELAKEPDIAPQPTPTVVFTVYPDGVTCQVTATLVNGQVIALPPIRVTPSGA